ncbi:MAG: hypothetical protein ACOCWE_07100, partial [Bacillota bacterium]
LVIFGIASQEVSAVELDLEYEINFDENFNIMISIFEGNNFNEVFQIGDKNFSFIFQAGENKEARVTQEGSGNQAVIRQSGNAEDQENSGNNENSEEGDADKEGD